MLALTSYPDPTPVSVLDDAVSFTATLGAHLAVVSCEVHVQIPGHFLSGAIANVPGFIAVEAEKSRKSARDMLAAFDAAAASAGVLHETYVENCPTFQAPELLADYARLRDLTIVPVTVTNEKRLDIKHSAEELAKNLTRHGIDVVLDKVDANGRPIGEVLETYTLSHQVDVRCQRALGIKWPKIPVRINPVRN